MALKSFTHSPIWTKFNRNKPWVFLHKVHYKIYLMVPSSFQDEWPLWLLSYGSWIYNYLCNQCLSPMKVWVRIPLRRCVFDTALCDKVCQWHATGWWFSPDTPVSSTNKTDRHDITEILLKVVLNTIALTLTPLSLVQRKKCTYSKLYMKRVSSLWWEGQFGSTVLELSQCICTLADDRCGLQWEWLL